MDRAVDRGPPRDIRVSTVEGVTYSAIGSTSTSHVPGRHSLEPQVLAMGRSVLFNRLQGVRRIAISDLSGRVVDRFDVNSESVSWAAQNASGNPLPQGVYRILFIGSQSSETRPLLLTR